MATRPADPAVIDAFRRQVPACRDSDSEFTARIFERCIEDLEAGGPIAQLVEAFDGNPILDALCQRVLGAGQGLLLEGKAPELAKLHPFGGGTPEWPATGDAFVAAVGAHLDEIQPRMKRQVQTNEVRRCCGLLGGFLEVARETGLPLRLLEMGSSAGLVMFWDRYRYELGPHRWGDPGAELTLACDWEGPAPDLDVPVEVASRRGCDIDPIDATDPEALRFIQSFYWADQPERMEMLLAAARTLTGPAPIDRIGGGAFVERELAELPAGVATVFFHSTMWWYLPREEQKRVKAAVEAAGERATPERPLAWLRSEPPSLEHVEVRLRMWPGGEDRLLATAQHHGRWVNWCA